MTEKEKLVIHSASVRIVFVALLGAIRELILAWLDKAVFTDKYIIKSGHKALVKMFRHFDKEGLNDNYFYDKLVGEFVDLATNMQIATEQILLQKDGDEQETAMGLSDTDSLDSKQA